MKTYSLDIDAVSEVVDIIAEKLELVTMDLEQRETLTEVVALSIALYFSKMTPQDSGGLQ
mgnify:CR=1 FL=1